MNESTILLSGISAVSGGLVFMWNQLAANTKKTDAKLDKCEESHRATHEQLIALSREIGELRGRQDGIQELAENVLRAIADIHQKP